MIAARPGGGSVWLLSDLHLPPGPSPLRDLFLRWLQNPARLEAAAVYLLGDLFEAWIGDDVGLLCYPAEVAALRALTGAGVPVYVQRGNRDFLLGAGFCRASGAQLLDDPAVQPLGGVPTLLSHGDLWCTRDRGYQRWRRFSRQGWAQWLFLRLPRSRRQAIALGLRASSRKAQQGKPLTITDVTPNAVEAALHRHGVGRVIHGHTHRPGEHTHGAALRLVLADWRGQSGGEALEVMPDGRWRRHALPLETPA